MDRDPTAAATVTDTAVIEAFIRRWEGSGAAERANYQLFLSELCDLLGAPRPDPATPDTSQSAYVFERPVEFSHPDGSTTTGFIDLYKRGCLLLEAKQAAAAPDAEEPLSQAAQDLKRRLRAGAARRGTVAWDDAMLRARGQAEQYIRALPVSEGRPPFLIVADVGHSLELYAEFSRTGGAYLPFPAAGNHRIFLADLLRPEIRQRLRAVWSAPLDLDPSRISARATRDIAARLARLAVSLEKAGHEPHAAAGFLMRCLFTMFAEDVGLLTPGGFSNLLVSLRDTPEHFVPMVEELWQRMDRGGFSTSLRTNILQFNGGLFEDATALPLNRDQVLLLIEAARCDWRDVEPAIFGTLLERALDPVERHKLGAHYTPRAYVERLVMPTVVEPVRAEWAAVHAAAVTLATAGDLKKAAAEVKAFHRRLCAIRVLDPACGSGNFLYVTLEHLKRIEGEVFDTLAQFGERQTVLEMAGEAVDPHQLLGLEVNPRAAAIAELVLWIGTLQWHFRNRGHVRPPQPIIRNFHNIECRDALIAWDAIEPELDADGRPVTRWDGRTTQPHPVTGREVPDESARVPVVRYVNPRPADWPAADYIVGNPPFIGAAIMRQALGDGYTETVRRVHADVGESSDFVMYWWNHAAALVCAGKAHRFGFVTTNSLRQTFNRRVIERYMSGAAATGSHPTLPHPLTILYAIPDHPWVDSADGAAVRIAMTVGAAGTQEGALARVVAETETGEDAVTVTLDTTRGRIHADLTTGADVGKAVPLKANSDLSSRGMMLFGSGFIVSPERATEMGLGQVSGLERYIRLYRNGRDLTETPRNVMVIDLFGLTAEEVRMNFPAVYQWVLEQVKPERDANRDASIRRQWWLHGRTRPELRSYCAGLPRYIATVETSKHRFFVFLDASILPDNKLINIALGNAFFLGVLSSRVHVAWALAQGSHLGVGNDPVYVKTRCFETFPFPDSDAAQVARIRELAEQLDAHRKRQQAAHPGLTMTGMYNVLEKLRSGEALTAKEKAIHEQGLVSVLRQLHDDLDAAVFAAYGWPATLTDAGILERLVALNAQRAEEESRGLIRWLRPEYQTRSASHAPQGEQTELAIPPAPQAPPPPASAPRSPWPKALPGRVSAVRAALAAHGAPATAADLARRFARVRPAAVEEILQTLVTLGQARAMPTGEYQA
jgi:hypothetical protein